MGNEEFYLGDPPSTAKEEAINMGTIDNNQENGVSTSSDIKKKGMTLKTIPMSLKKIRKVIDEVKDRSTPVTPEEKFDLSITGSYLSYLATTVQDMVAKA